MAETTARRALETFYTRIVELEEQNSRLRAMNENLLMLIEEVPTHVFANGIIAHGQDEGEVGIKDIIKKHRQELEVLKEGE